MRDRLFTGSDVQEALAAAAATFGLPIAELRYVVLEQGSTGGRGLKPTPARIAVLVQEARPEGSARSARGPAETPDAALPRPAGDVRASVRAVVRAVADAAGLAVDVAFEETEEALVVQLRGEDGAFFDGEEGEGDVLAAVEHLLQRMHGPALHPLKVRLRCEGFRERRDAALAEEARRLAAAVRDDGEPRTMAPQNAYERRIVHMALQEEPGVMTYSVGEGRERRVTVAPAGPKTTNPGDGGEGDAR